MTPPLSKESELLQGLQAAAIARGYPSVYRATLPDDAPDQTIGLKANPLTDDMEIGDVETLLYVTIRDSRGAGEDWIRDASEDLLLLFGGMRYRTFGSVVVSRARRQTAASVALDAQQRPIRTETYVFRHDRIGLTQ